MQTKRQLQERVAELEQELESIQDRISSLLGTNEDGEEEEETDDDDEPSDD